MLSMTNESRAKKTSGCAVTYRSGAGTMYGTCPSSCPLMPADSEGTDRIDWAYFDAVLGAVPTNGHAFTYTHFPPSRWHARYLRRAARGEPVTVVNWSADDTRSAARAVKRGIPIVLAASSEVIRGRKVWTEHGSRFVQCPAVTDPRQGVTCSNCGGRKGPLCARADRGYVIVFEAHGAARKRVGSPERGGCYAAVGNVALHWRHLAQRGSGFGNDGAKLREWVRALPAGTVLRHHVAGDIGRQIHG